MRKSQRRRPLRAATAAAGALSIGAASMWGTSPAAAAAPAKPAAHHAKTAAKAGPPPVVGLTFLLNTMDTGQKIGIAELYNLGVSALSTALPAPAQAGAAAPLVNGLYKVLAVPPPVFAKMATESSAYIAEGKTAIAPLAALNPAGNAAIASLSKALITLAVVLTPVIQPFNVTVEEIGAFLTVLESVNEAG